MHNTYYFTIILLSHSNLLALYYPGYEANSNYSLNYFGLCLISECAMLYVLEVGIGIKRLKIHQNSIENEFIIFLYKEY